MQAERIHGSSEQTVSTRASAAKPRIRSFDLRRHLAQTARAASITRHARIGLQNWLTTEMMNQALRSAPNVPREYEPRADHYERIRRELHSYSVKDKYTMVLFTMPFLGTLVDDGSTDWVTEMTKFERLDMPDYYVQPFHSIPGGWLNPISAVCNTTAFRALYRRAHRKGADGVREEIAGFVPEDAKVVYDFGASTGGQSAVIARRLGPDATVYAVEPAPPGIIQGRRDVLDPRVEWVHNFVEKLDLPEGSADAVNMMFVAHECPDRIKRELLKAAYKVLKPGGVFVWTDPPPDDLCLRSRGFFEPYAWQWQQWSPDRELKDVGFREVETHHVVDPQYMWTRVAKK